MRIDDSEAGAYSNSKALAHEETVEKCKHLTTYSTRFQFVENRNVRNPTEGFWVIDESGV